MRERERERERERAKTGCYNANLGGRNEEHRVGEKKEYKKQDD